MANKRYEAFVTARYGLDWPRVNHAELASRKEELMVIPLTEHDSPSLAGYPRHPGSRRSLYTLDMSFEWSTGYLEQVGEVVPRWSVLNYYLALAAVQFEHFLSNQIEHELSAQGHMPIDSNHSLSAHKRSVLKLDVVPFTIERHVPPSYHVVVARVACSHGVRKTTALRNTNAY